MSSSCAIDRPDLTVSAVVSKSSATAWYDSPLYYDMVYADYTRKETRFIEQVMRLHEPGLEGPLRVLEPACGSGRLLESLAARGHVVHGFDLNRHQVAFARRRLTTHGLGGKVWRDALEDFTVPSDRPYDIAHCLVSTFKYIRTERGAVSCLRRIASVLRPGGFLLLGLHLTDYRRNPPDHERWVGRRPGVRVVSDTWSDPADRRARTESMRTRMRITEKGVTRVEETHWKFRTYSPSELRGLLAQVPAFRRVAAYDFRYDLDSPRRLDLAYSDIILVLRRT